jgi:isopentenyl-diphosphate Delta-isomerase
MEFFDVLDENGNKTGEIIERNEAHKKGICHRVVQVWVINSNNELLLQKRSANKDSCPNMWYVSLGGHIESNEDNKQTIIREFYEELGLNITSQIDKVKYLYTFKEIVVLNNGQFIDNEFYDVYLLKMDLDPSTLILQEDEVSEVKFMGYDAFKQVVMNKDENFWIHEEGFHMLFDCLDDYLNNN